MLKLFIIFKEILKILEQCKGLGEFTQIIFEKYYRCAHLRILEHRLIYIHCIICWTAKPPSCERLRDLSDSFARLEKSVRINFGHADLAITSGTFSEQFSR